MFCHQKLAIDFKQLMQKFFRFREKIEETSDKFNLAHDSSHLTKFNSARMKSEKPESTVKKLAETVKESESSSSSDSDSEKGGDKLDE